MTSQQADETAVQIARILMAAQRRSHRPLADLLRMEIADVAKLAGVELTVVVEPSGSAGASAPKSSTSRPPYTLDR